MKKDVFQNCPTYQSERFEIRKMEMKDAHGLFQCYSEYSCAGVPLFRRNGYRQSGGRKPLFRNRDTALT